MMAVMTVQPPLPLVAGDARPVGAAAAIVEDGDGGRVFVHGNLAYAWDVGDCAARRFAAVSLMRIKAATQLEVAEAFAVKPATVRRWETWLTESGVVGLLGERKGPKRKSKLTAEAVARIQGLRDGGASYRAIAAETGVSEGSVRNALVLADDGARTEEACPATTSDVPPEPEPEPEPEGEPEGEPEVEKDCSAAISDDRAGPVQVPVLAEPVARGAERALAAFGLIGYAPPVFTGCARAPLAGLFLALPALTATGLLAPAHTVYGEWPNGFYSLDTIARACSAPCWGRPARRAPPGSTRPRWAGCWVWTGRRRSRRSAARSGCSPGRARPAAGSPRWRAVMCRPAPRRRRCAMSTGLGAA